MERLVKCVYISIQFGMVVGWKLWMSVYMDEGSVNGETGSENLALLPQRSCHMILGGISWHELIYRYPSDKVTSIVKNNQEKMAILVHTKTGIPQFAGTCVSKTTPPPIQKLTTFFVVTSCERPTFIALGNITATRVPPPIQNLTTFSRGDLVRASNLHS